MLLSVCIVSSIEYNIMTPIIGYLMVIRLLWNTWSGMFASTLKRMEKEKIMHTVALIYGIVASLFIALIFVPKLMGAFHSTSEFISSVTQWYDNPIGFVFLYFTGYIVLWWKKLTGSLIILGACALFFGYNPNNYMFLKVFLLPAMMVGVLYIVSFVMDSRMVE